MFSLRLASSRIAASVNSSQPRFWCEPACDARTVSVAFNTVPVEIMSPYQYGAKKSKSNEKHDKIFSPIPGKVVRVLVKEGELVKAGSPVIIIEAMKMQSEYKVKDDCIVKRVLVSEGENISGNQSLIELGEAPNNENNGNEEEPKEV